MSTSDPLRCPRCHEPPGRCDCPECESCGVVCADDGECERRRTLLPEAHVGAKQILDWLREYDRDSGGPVVGLQAHYPQLGERVVPIVREIKSLASDLENLLWAAAYGREPRGPRRIVESSDDRR